MSQMSYADRQLETALTAMFEQRVTENRSTMRYWPAVSDRLGEQVSRKPWEYVMDAINRPRMPFNTRYIYAAGSALVVVIAVLLLVLLLNTDDGTTGESVPADTPEQIVPIADSGLAGGAFDPDAEAEIIRFRFDQKWEAYRLQDWDAYRAFCLPTQREEMSDDYLQNFYDTWLVYTGQTTEGFGTRISNVLVMSPIDSLVEYQTTEFSEPLEVQGILWTNVDGSWYSTVCTPWPL